MTWLRLHRENSASGSEGGGLLNVMSYEPMNRRRDATIHYTGMAASEKSIEAYLKRGARPDQPSLAFTSDLDDKDGIDNSCHHPRALTRRTLPKTMSMNS